VGLGVKTLRIAFCLTARAARRATPSARCYAIRNTQSPFSTDWWPVTAAWRFDGNGAPYSSSCPPGLVVIVFVAGGVMDAVAGGATGGASGAYFACGPVGVGGGT